MLRDPGEQSGKENPTRGQTPPSDGAVSADEQLAQDQNNQGIWLITTGKLDQAAQCFRKACTAWPKLTTAWLNLATVLVMLGREEEAILAIRQATRAGAVSRSMAARYRESIRHEMDRRNVLARRQLLQKNRKHTPEEEHELLAGQPVEACFIEPASLLDTAGFGVYTGAGGICGA